MWQNKYSYSAKANIQKLFKKCIKYGQKTQYWIGDYKHCKTLPKRHTIPSWVAKFLQSHNVQRHWSGWNGTLAE